MPAGKRSGRDIRAVCDPKYRAVHDSGVRQRSEIKYVVIHATEGDIAEGAASWFQNPNSTGSANLVLDDDACFRTLPDLRVPWAAPPLNTAGFHIEIAGYSRWSRPSWLNHGDRLHRAAYKTATRCVEYGIPVRQVGPVGLRLRRKGITSHRAVSLAFRKSDHTDPGTGFPWDVFIGLVRDYAAELAL